MGEVDTRRLFAMGYGSFPEGAAAVSGNSRASKIGPAFPLFPVRRGLK